MSGALTNTNIWHNEQKAFPFVDLWCVMPFFLSFFLGGFLFVFTFSLRWVGEGGRLLRTWPLIWRRRGVWNWTLALSSFGPSVNKLWLLLAEIVKRNDLTRNTKSYQVLETTTSKTRANTRNRKKKQKLHQENQHQTSERERK